MTQTEFHTEIETKVWKLAEPLAQARGLEVFLVEFKPGGRLLRVYLDRKLGSVGLDDCQAVSEKLSEILDQEDIIPHAYRLEVSSPGWDRPLRGQEDYLRFRGEMARLWLFQPVSGSLNLTGRIGEIQNGMLRFYPLGQDPLWLPLSQIRSARLDPSAAEPSARHKQKKRRNKHRA